MVLYGASGIGKTVFATSAPNFYAITADANYDWVEDFGMTPDRYTQVNSWADFQKALASIKYDEYDTIVIDSFEKVYDWACREFCKAKGVESLGDYKSMGAGFDEVRKKVVPVMEHLFQRDKNILVILHETETSDKDTRKGRELAKHRPNLNEKILLSLASNASLVVRAYCETQMDANGNTIEHRFIGLAPDNVNEFGFVRGLASDRPFEIPLDWNALEEVMRKYPVKVVRYTPGDDYMTSADIKKANATAKQDALKQKIAAKKAGKTETKVETKAETNAEVDDVVDETEQVVDETVNDAPVEEQSELDKAREVVKEEAFDTSLSPEAYEKALDEAYPDSKVEKPQPAQPKATTPKANGNTISPEKAARIAEIKAKLEAKKKK